MSNQPDKQSTDKRLSLLLKDISSMSGQWTFIKVRHSEYEATLKRRGYVESAVSQSRPVESVETQTSGIEMELGGYIATIARA